MQLPQARVIVVAGVLSDSSGAVLIAQRPLGKHLAGGWEFPGGKIQGDESDAQALARELLEELGVTVLTCSPFMSLIHAYPDRNVELRLRIVEAWCGTVQGLDGQALRWVPLKGLQDADILDADRPFIAALQAHAAGGR